MTVVLDVGDPTPLGRIKLHDSRSREFAYPVARSTVSIGSRSITHRMDSEHLDQFFLGGCVGFSGSQMLNCRIACKSRQKFNVLSSRTAFDYGFLDNNDGIENYTRATQFDDFDWTYPPVDNGSSALGLMKWWLKFGIIRSYRWAFTFEQFLSALGKQPVLLGTNWYGAMTDPMIYKGRYLAMPYGEEQGGHEFLANGILGPAKLIRCEQSWGESFKAKTFYITFEHVRTLLEQGGDVAIPEFL